MKLFVDHTCYTHLMWMLTYRPREFAKAITRYECTQPDFDSEGVAGYISCKIAFDIADISLFAKIWNEWYTADNRQELYAQITRSRC